MPTNDLFREQLRTMVETYNLIGLDRLSEAVHLCKACPLGTRGHGVPGRWSSTNPATSGGIMVLGEAPGTIEQERGMPFVGQSGDLLRSMLSEVGLTSYYVSNIVKHQPFKDKQGKQQAPSKTEIEACAPFLRAEFDLIRPAKLILLGKTAAKLVVDGNFSMKVVVNGTYKYGPCDHDHLCPIHETGVCPVNQLPTLILYHPAYFLRQRTAPWIQKQIADWKRAVRMFLGDRPPTYQIERVECETHDAESTTLPLVGPDGC